MRGNLRIRGLYALTPEVNDAAYLYPLVEQALRGGVALLQYRDKRVEDRYATARELRVLCERYAVPFIVNDDAELAACVGADGVHLGGDDMHPRDARALLGDKAIIGVSCYNSLRRAKEAWAEGADYVAFGSVFVSQVKPQAVRAPLSLIQAARAEVALPIVAIGGIDLDNAPRVLEAGADAIAVISALFGAPDVRARAQAFAGLFAIPSATTPWQANDNP